MPSSIKKIINDITSYLRDNEISLDDVYVGIASYPEQRLFSDHNVSKENGIWIYCKAYSSLCVRIIEKYFLDDGANGGPGGGMIKLFMFMHMK